MLHNPASIAKFLGSFWSTTIWCLCFWLLSTASIANTEVQISIGNSAVKQFQVLQDTFRYTRTSGKKIGEFPSTNLDLVITAKGRAIPSERGLKVTKNKYWDILFEPGHWYTRDKKVSIVLPFSLVEKNANCTHQGMIIIETDSSGYQISSETCQYFQFNVLGTADVTISAKTDSHSMQGLSETLATEIRNRLPEKSIETISEAYPKLDSNIFAQLDYIPASSMTAFGVLLDGNHYVSGCPTRATNYPDCSHMALPAYSLAKSLIGGIGLMRLEALHPGAKDALVKDLVPECSKWGNIALKHLLNNTTGRYGSSKPHSDEDNHLLPFLNEVTVKDKTKHVCSRYRVKSQPGEQWVYHTTEFWLLGVAMQSYWEQIYGKGKDFYDDVLVPIWRELGLSPLLDKPHRLQGHPLTGFGLMLLRSDVAKLGNALSSDNSLLKKYLDHSMLVKAMQKDALDRGSIAGSDDLRFQNGFWAWNAGPILGCSEDKWLPFMSGYGGISVVSLPDGNVYYYFSDGGVFRYAEVIKHLNTTISIC
jgi:hypothetical protein